MTTIARGEGPRIWDSRGRPTVEIDVTLADGSRGRGMAPAGASMGSGEALELRDGGERLGGYDVKRAVELANTEVRALLVDVRETGVDIVTIGQYLQPSKDHLPVHRYVPPDDFAAWRAEGFGMGFSHVESGPLVRSSYHAAEQVLP